MNFYTNGQRVRTLSFYLRPFIRPCSPVPELAAFLQVLPPISTGLPNIQEIQEVLEATTGQFHSGRSVADLGDSSVLAHPSVLLLESFSWKAQAGFCQESVLTWGHLGFCSCERFTGVKEVLPRGLKWAWVRSLYWLKRLSVFLLIAPHSVSKDYLSKTAQGHTPYFRGFFSSLLALDGFECTSLSRSSHLCRRLWAGYYF